MKEIQLIIPPTSEGLHVRPASEFVKLAAKFPCEIQVIKEDIEVNGKSIMGIMMLALGPGDTFTIRTEGENERQAIEELEQLVNKSLE